MTKLAVERSLEDYILRARPAIEEFKKVVQIATLALGNPTNARKLVSRCMADEKLALNWWWLLKLSRDAEKKFGVRFEEVLSSIILSQNQEEVLGKLQPKQEEKKMRKKDSLILIEWIRKTFRKMGLSTGYTHDPSWMVHADGILNPDCRRSDVPNRVTRPMILITSATGGPFIYNNSYRDISVVVRAERYLNAAENFVRAYRKKTHAKAEIIKDYID